MDSRWRRPERCLAATALLLLTGLAAAAVDEGPSRRGLGRPDFVVDAVSLVPPAPAAGEQIYVSVTVRNRGRADGAVGTVAVWVDTPARRRLAPVPDVSAEVGIVAAGERATQVLGPLPAPADRGGYTLSVVVDHEHTTRETNEQNNVAKLRYDVRAAAQPAIAFTGTVVFQAIEGGFYAIAADDGRRFDPLGLPDDFAVDGLRVWVSAQICPNVMTFHMYGTVIRILEIRSLEASAAPDQDPDRAPADAP